MPTCETPSVFGETNVRTTKIKISSVPCYIVQQFMYFYLSFLGGKDYRCSVVEKLKPYHVKENNITPPLG